MIDAVTGKPVKLRADPETDVREYCSVAIKGPARPTSGAASNVAMIRKDGTYRIRVAPGSNYIFFSTIGPWGATSPPNDAVGFRFPGSNHYYFLIKVAEGETVKFDFRVLRR